MSEDLLANYQRAYGTRIGFGKKPALVLIDFCRGYYEPACDLYCGQPAFDALASALRLRAVAREAGVPVILTCVQYHASGVDGGRFFEKAAPLRYFVKGHPMAEWGPGLMPFDDELVIPKQYPSAFFATSLASTLTAMGVDSVLLTGLSTSGCVRASCVDAMSHGFKTAVIADACGDRHAAPHEANLFDMNAKYADVVSEAEAITFLASLQASFTPD
ncbi:isochorismatase family protein [Novosphingobium umbonatum]|uniref:Isochorismatase family protein n=1 Tax=Novosphingobium umbonatum TaxID=1908524 RepID=A0A3S2VVN6_9SPHN|nr:isochorismatase family protein [Novosphingobium umbonatum]RVU06968.1 isochorismatase family protein [Novosphingobium umbonatum]